MRVIGVIIAIWLIVGLIAAIQRGYLSSATDNCATVGSTLVTVFAGPLNYAGVNPKLTCSHATQPLR
jgi:hypothetical protein